MRRVTRFTTAAFLACALVGGARAQAAPFDSMVVFGDSLSDNGNVSATLGLPRMRFTTNPGLVMVEDVGLHYGFTLEPSLAGGTNYAYGGAGVLDDMLLKVPTVADQVNGYLAAHAQADPKGLYVIWGGSNDVFFQSSQILAGAKTLDQANARLTAAAQLEGALINQLQGAGVRTMIVLNLPDSGLTPGGLPMDTSMAQTFNAVLNGQLAGRHGVVVVNTYALLHEVVANPAAYGFSNVTSPACTVSPALLCTPQTLVQPNAASTYLFADDIHPATTADADLAEVVISELNAPGQMSLLAEAPLAMLREHRSAVHDQLDQASASTQGLTLFATGRAGRRALDGDWAAPSSSSDDDSATVGGVWRSSGGLSLGAALTAGQSRFSLQGGLGGFDARQTVVSAFGQYDWANGAWASLQAGLGGVKFDDISRSFVIGTALRTERSTSSGHDDSVELAGGETVTLGGLRTGPFAALSYDRVRVGDVAEAGGDSTAMWFAAQTREAVVSRVGWSLKGDTRLGGLDVQPIAALAWGHDFRADRRAVVAGLTTLNGDFSMAGYQPSRDWGEATLGLGTDLGRGFHAQISYRGLYGDRGHENMGVAGVSLSF